MNGEWVILIWALVSVIFLVKIPSVREFFAQLRKMSAIGIICIGLSLGFLAKVSYTKDGVSTNQSVPQASVPLSENSAAVALPNSSSLILQPSSLPESWKDDPTDTDEDGIPDLWEKWTHGKKLVDDSDLDRDSDGLTDLEEFWNQTDPRTADTDGDSFSDAFEVANGMNPISAEDFVPVEPDTNNNGVPDIWEQIGYSGSFYDANGNGFDDTYEQAILPVASDSNFDVFVDVYTTRSATLNWTSGEDRISILMLPTTGTSVKIRLPFGTDAELYLQSSPYGTDLPSGELWKSRMRISFAPRTGQTAIGTCIVSTEGDISQKVVEQAMVITRFSDPIASKQMRSLNSGDGDYPRIQILEKRFEVVPESKLFHAGDVTVGLFSITNTVNIDSVNVTWSVSHGSMSPLTGDSSSLFVGSIPDGDEPIIITAEVELDELFSAVDTAEVRLCRHEGFSLDSYTSNFSPQLGETNVISVTLPGCVHQNDPGWLEIEVMRETTAGWQHVAWIDMDTSTSGVDRYGDAMQLPHHPIFIWDGIAQTSLPLADHPDVFTGPKGSFNRAMPAVVTGEPVPPPFYTFVVRLWNSDKSLVVDMVERKIYIPQVVNLVLFGGEDIVQQPVYALGTNGAEQITLYPGSTSAEAEAALAQLPAMAMAFFPSDVNLRIVMTDTVVGRHKSMLIVGESSHEGRRGDASAFSKRNERSYGDMAIYIKGFQESLQNNYDRMLGGNQDIIPVPMTSEQFAKYIAPTVAHETGHGLGLVDPDWLPATPPGDQKLHNKVQSWVKIMDMGGLFYVKDRLDPHPTDYWRFDNLRYLRFILPKGE